MPSDYELFAENFNLDLVPEQIYRQWMIEKGMQNQMMEESYFSEDDNLIFLQGGSQFIDELIKKPQDGSKLEKVSDVEKKVRKYLKEEVASLKDSIESEANRRLKNANMDRTFQEIKKVQKKSGKLAQKIGLIPRRHEIK